MATASERKLQYVLKMCQNGQKWYFLNHKKVKKKDSNYKSSSLAGQIGCKNTKEKSKLLVKCYQYYEIDLQVIQKKTSKIALGMSQNCLQSHCLKQKKVNKKDSDLKKKEKEKNKLLSNRFGNWFRKKTPMCAKNVPKRPEVLFWNWKKSETKG